MASMKPHSSVNQLLWALVLVGVVVLTEMLQFLQPKKETSWFLLCSAVPLHYFGFVLSDECVSCTRALHGWLPEHPHVQGQPQKMKQNRALSLMLLKSNELVVVDSARQELMRSGVEDSWIFLFHLLVFLLCLHFIILVFLAFLSFSCAFSRLIPCVVGVIMHLEGIF